MVIVEAVLVAIWVLCRRLGEVAKYGHMVWKIVINEEAVHIDQAKEVIIFQRGKNYCVSEGNAVEGRERVPISASCTCVWRD